MNTKKKEIIITVHDTQELEAVNKKEFCFTASNVLKTWTEDFIDEDTGELVTVERSEVVFPRGEFLMPNDFSELLFRLQTGDVSEVQLSNVQRSGIITNGSRFRLWVVKVDGIKKLKLLLRADNAMAAYEVAKDYIELNYKGTFTIESIKTFTDCIVIEPKEGEEKNNISVDRWWYMVQVEALQEHKDGEPVFLYSSTFVVFAENVESAKVIIDRYIAEEKAKRGEAEKKDVVLRTSSVSTISCNVVVPAEFCFAYTSDSEECER